MNGLQKKFTVKRNLNRAIEIHLLAYAPAEKILLKRKLEV